MSEYWQEYWNSVIIEEDEQKQVKRTLDKKEVSAEIWRKTIGFISNQAEIKPDSDVLELCCGNGMITLPIAGIANSVIAVDFSDALISVLNRSLDSGNIKNVTTIKSDVNDFYFAEESYSNIILYFAIQYLTEKDTVILFEKAFKSLRSGGVFYVGDIPDREKLWDFANTDTYVKQYFESIKADAPAIGTWFLKNDLVKLAHYVGFAASEIIIQPDYQINSRYRFDFIMRKH